MFDLFCVFKQKTAYDMRISDWSSDVCSSDLGSIAVGHEKRAKAYTPIRNARQMREMIEAAKLYERQTLAQRRTTTPRIRNGAIGQAGIQIIEFLARVIDYSTGALFPSLHTIMEGTGLSKNCEIGRAHV